MLRERVASAAREFAGDLSDVRWVEPAAFHITLRFLGDTPASRVALAGEAVASVAPGQSPVRVALGVGIALGAGGGTVLAVSVSRGSDEIVAVERRLTDALASRGWPPEVRAFRPHVTLGRLRSRRGSRDTRRTVRELARAIDASDVAWTAAEVVLFESHLGNGPPRHEARMTAPFGPIRPGPGKSPDSRW